MVICVNSQSHRTKWCQISKAVAVVELRFGIFEIKTQKIKCLKGPAHSKNENLYFLPPA